MQTDVAGLFQTHVKGLKRTGTDGQYHGHCPFHADRKPSFSANLDSGLWICHAACGEGDAATFAERVGVNPKPYYRGRNSSPPPGTVTLQAQKETPLPESEIEKARNWCASLRDNFDSLTEGLPWTREVVKKAGVGYDPDTGRFIYVHRDSQGQVMNIKHGKGRGGQVPYSVQGYGQTRLYPAHLLKEYNSDSIIYCEGEKDVVSLLSHGFQPVTGTTGAGSVPPDLRPLSRFKAVMVILDNDEKGKTGSVKVADAILAQCPETGVFISYWPEDRPEGYDITDFFQDGDTAEDFERLMLKVQDLYQQIPPESTAQSEINVREPVCIRMSDVEPEEVRWLWLPYIPLGKLTILEGDPGVGKTWLAVQLAGTISRGDPFPGPDGTPRERRNPSNALYMSAEDGLADTLRPRLDAAGADASRVIVLEGWRKQMEEGEQTGQVTLHDIPIIEQALVKYHPSLLVVDPLQAFFGSDVDYHRANETRPILAALGRLAEKYGVSVLCIRHLGKSKKDRAIYQGLGSIDFSAAARSILLVGKDPDNPRQRVVAHVKSNLVLEGPSIGFELSEGRFLWTGTSELTAEALLGRQGSEFEMSAVDEACEWLRETLSDGPVMTKEMRKQAKDQGLSEATVRRAKKHLQVRSVHEGFGKDSTWLWGLPIDAQNPQRCSHIDNEHLCTESGEFLDGNTIDAQGKDIPKDERLCKSTTKAPLKTQSGLVRCGDCSHFIPDPVNPPQGIGACKVDAPYSPNDPARYPKAKRHCKRFQEAEMVA